MNRIVFLETPLQGAAYIAARHQEPPSKLIALTAQAAEWLDENKIPYESIACFANTVELAAVEDEFNLKAYELARSFEDYVAGGPPSSNAAKPGILTGHTYFIQYAISAILTRSHLIRQAILALKPSAVMAYKGPVDPLFKNCGYMQNPWWDILTDISKKENFTVELRDISNIPSTERSEAWRYLWPRLISFGRRRFHQIMRFRRSKETNLHWKGLRLLLMDGDSSDWTSVVDTLKDTPETSCYEVDKRYLEGNEWELYYLPHFRECGKWTHTPLNIPPLNTKSKASRTLLNQFDEWASTPSTHPPMQFLSVDLFNALKLFLRSLIGPSVEILHYTDEFADKTLSLLRPHAVCFNALPRLASQRFAFRCHERGIPVICYQHGGTYGTHTNTPHEQSDFTFADYFLRYGPGIDFREKPPIPLRAKLVSVGSGRIASELERIHVLRKPRKPFRILWIAEASNNNTVGGTFTLEDTRRFILEKKTLSLLMKNPDLRITYRPMLTQIDRDGTTRWIHKQGRSNIRVIPTGSLWDLMASSDMIVADISSNTTWHEAIALGKPFILFTDPKTVVLAPRYQADLEKACRWCKTEEDFMAAIQQLSANPSAAIHEAVISRDILKGFCQRYIFDPDQNPSKTVLNFLQDLRR